MKKDDQFEKYRFLNYLEGVPEHEEMEHESWWALICAVAPGIMVCGLITLAAILISEHYTSPVMLLCLLIGMAFHFLYEDQKTQRGIQFTSQEILKLGVALIGARIMLSQFTAIGLYALIGISTITLVILILGPILGKLFGLDRDQGLLIGGATAVCGASAALAISSVLPPSKKLEQQTLTAVIGVTAMGTMAMITYPVILAFLGVDEFQAGVIIGGTIHDVSQVVGAGYSISAEAGDTAVLIKLIRVFMLLPILLGLAWIYKTTPNNNKSRIFSIPLFLVGFVVLASLNSLEMLPSGVPYSLGLLSKWMLIMAISAVGLKTSMKEVLSLGYGPALLVVAETAILFAFYCVLTSMKII